MAPVIKISLLVLLLAGCQASPLANRNSTGKTIVCFGDSLTAGTGAEPGGDYPTVLGRKVPLPVINAGIPGDTTASALRRLDTDVLGHEPRIVIITLGGNDFLQRLPKDETLRNMEAIIDRIHANGAMVVWAAVKTGFFADRYTKDFQALARRKRILLIPDVLKDIMFDVRYKYDEIHPNSEGYKFMAEKIHRAITHLLRSEK